MAVFDIGPIKWPAENHRLSLAPTLRWGQQPPLSLMLMLQQATSRCRKYKSSACNRFCLRFDFCWNEVHLTRLFLLFWNWIICTLISTGIALVLVPISGLNIPTHKLYRRTEPGFDFNEETLEYRETRGLLQCSSIWWHHSISYPNSDLMWRGIWKILNLGSDRICNRDPYGALFHLFHDWISPHLNETHNILHFDRRILSVGISVINTKEPF